MRLLRQAGLGGTGFDWHSINMQSTATMDLISAIHPGGCEHHTHPARILKVRAPRRGVPGQDIRPLTVRAQDPEVLAAMRDEVVSFVSEYLPGVDPAGRATIRL